MFRVTQTLLLTSVIAFGATGVCVLNAAELAAETETPVAVPFEKFREAFNAGDVDALVALFLPSAEYLDETGVAHSGHEGMRELFTAFFESFPGAQMNMDIESVREITPDLALSDLVRSTRTAEGTERAVVRSAVTLVRVDGQWQIASVRDVTADHELSHHDQVEPLSWMLGEWVEEEAESLVQMKCEWTPDGNYLLLDYVIQREGQPALASQQRIGWDPVHEQLRSWIFDADGGFGGGLWTQVDDSWVIKNDAVLPDGTTGSATFVLQPLGEDRFVMRGLDRILGDEVQPDVEMTIVRKPPRSDE